MASEEIFQSKAQKTNQQEQKTSVCPREVCTVFPGPGKRQTLYAALIRQRCPKGWVAPTRAMYTAAGWTAEKSFQKRKEKKNSFNLKLTFHFILRVEIIFNRLKIKLL